MGGYGMQATWSLHPREKEESENSQRHPSWKSELRATHSFLTSSNVSLTIEYINNNNVISA